MNVTDSQKKTEHLQAEIVELRSQIDQLKKVQLGPNRLEEIGLKEARMAATLDALPDLMFEIDAEGRFYEFRSTSDFDNVKRTHQTGL